MKRGLLAWLVAWSCAVFACQAERAPNEIIVVVDSDMRIGTDLKSLDIEITDHAVDAGVLNTNHFELVAEGSASPQLGQFTLPLSFVIAPLAQRSSRDFRLVVSGRALDGDQVVVEQQLISSFRPDYSGRLVVFLAQRCMQQLCFKDGKRSTETCNPSTGMCVETPVVVPEKASTDDLAGYLRQDAAIADQKPDSGDADASATDAGTPPTDAGSSNPTDANIADAAVADAYVPPPPSDNVMIAASGTKTRAAASPKGHGVIVYQVLTNVPDQNTGPISDVYARLYDPIAGWGAPFRLSEKRRPEQSDGVPWAIFDPQGNLTVAWMRNYTLIARRNLVGTRSWEDEVILRDNDAYGSLNMVVDPAGNVMLAFRDNRDRYNAARWETSTQRWNSLYGYVDDPAYPNDTGIMPLACDAAGNITAAWPLGNEGKVVSKRFDASAKAWSGPVIIRNSTPNTIQMNNARPVARNDGSVLVMWSESDLGTGNDRVGASIWDPALKVWRGSTPDSSVLRIGEGSVTAIAADPDGAFLAFWDRRIRTHSGSAGASFGAAVPVGRDGSVIFAGDTSVTMSVDPNGKRIATWAQFLPGGADVAWSKAERPSTGPEVWSDIMLLGAHLAPGSLDTSFNIGYPTMSLGAPGTALIGWSQALSNDAIPQTAVYARWVTF